MMQIKKAEIEMAENEDIEKPTAQGSNVDPVAQKTLLRKLDYRMMPVFFFLYFLNHCSLSCGECLGSVLY